MTHQIGGAKCKGCGEYMNGIFCYSIRVAHGSCGDAALSCSKTTLRERIKDREMSRRKNVPLTKSGNDVA